MENTPTNSSLDVTKSPYLLNLNYVDWKQNYKLSEASIGQIMVSFRNILNVKPKNNYEEILYSHIKPDIQNLINKYEQILDCKNFIEQNVKYFNLIDNLPFGVKILDNEHGNVLLGRAKLGFLIRAIIQRITFIENRELPICYQDNIVMKEEFEQLKIKITEFKQDIWKFEVIFVGAIDRARRA
jgi:hypothetical protein